MGDVSTVGLVAAKGPAKDYRESSVALQGL
jgi:hypothetical protein